MQLVMHQAQYYEEGKKICRVCLIYFGYGMFSLKNIPRQNLCLVLNLNLESKLVNKA